MESSGAGDPTVVLVAGYLGRGDVWSRDNHQPAGEREMVYPAVSGFTHVCAYDRPGTIGEVNPDLEPSGPLFYPSRSDPVPQPRTAQDIVSELHALLEAAAVPKPYVLVGHSFGGLCSRLYASTYPEDVVGMVLVDAAHEDFGIEFKERVTPSVWDVFEQAATDNPELLAVYPEYERVWTIPILDDPSFAQMRQARSDSPLRPMPLVVISRAVPDPAPYPEWPTDVVEQVWAEMQDDLAGLVPNAQHITATKSGHNVHQDEPELVIEAARQVVEAVRDPSTWSS